MIVLLAVFLSVISFNSRKQVKNQQVAAETAEQSAPSLADAYSELNQEELTDDTGQESKPIEADAVTDAAAEKGETRAVGDVTFKVSRTKTVVSLNTVDIRNDFGNIASLTFRKPAGLTIVPGTVPAGWTTLNKPTDSVVNYLMTTNNTVAKVESFLAQVKFNVTDESKVTGDIGIEISNRTVSAWVDPAGTTHYYEFVGNPSNWSQSYNNAKRQKYKGLTGYLATITSLEEQNYIYNTIAKSPGFLGGTRLTDSKGAKFNDQTVVPSLGPSASKWYWATGPEAGLEFYNTEVASSAGPVPGVFNNFSPGEPNNDGGRTTESVIQFAFNNSSKWNDTIWIGNEYAFNQGFYVEYSQYGNQVEDVGTSMPIPKLITVNYLEDGTNKVLSAQTIMPNTNSIVYGAAYDSTTVEKAIAGYGVPRVVGSKTGVYDKTAKTITYYYKAITIGQATAYYQDEAGVAIPGYPAIVQSGQSGIDTFTFSQLVIPNYEFVKVEGLVTGKFAETPLITTFTYRSTKFNLNQTVKHLDGSAGAEAKLGETLQYQVEFNSNFKAATPEVLFKTLTIREPLDANLEEPTNMALKLSNGKSVGKVTYDKATRMLTATLAEADKVVRSEILVLEYQAVVKVGTPINSLIKEKANAESSYSNGSVSSKQDSNEVSTKVLAGSLIFESAPSTLSFGDPVKISSIEKNYPLQVKTGDLSVRDLRGTGKQWSMTAKMVKVLTNTSNNSQLPEGMYYVNNGKEQVMKLNQAILIQDTTTTTTNSVILSEKWGTSTNSFFVKTVGGQAKRGTYQGTIEWTLQDVPSGMPSSSSLP